MKSINIKKRGINVHLDLSRFETNFDKAQEKLTSMVLKDTDDWVPFETGGLSGSPQASPSSLKKGKIIYSGPYAHYLYYGRLYVDPLTGSSWARKNVKKVKVNKALTYSKSVHNKATSFWFQRSKAVNKDRWIKETKRVAGGG